MVERMMSMMT